MPKLNEMVSDLHYILVYKNKKIECSFQRTGNALIPQLYVDDGPGSESFYLTIKADFYVTFSVA